MIEGGSSPIGDAPYHDVPEMNIDAFLFNFWDQAPPLTTSMAFTSTILDVDMAWVGNSENTVNAVEGGSVSEPMTHFPYRYNDMETQPEPQYPGSMMELLFSNDLNFNQPSVLQESPQTLIWNWDTLPLPENPHPHVPVSTNSLPEMALDADPKSGSLPLLPPPSQAHSPTCHPESGNGASGNNRHELEPDGTEEKVGEKRGRIEVDKNNILPQGSWRKKTKTACLLAGENGQ